MLPIMQRGILFISVTGIWLYPKVTGSGTALPNASLYVCKNFCIMVYHINFLQSYKFNFNFHHVL